MGKVVLVGAGPGDPGLLTLKAARVLAEADVVFYDRLVSEAVLAYASPQAELVYVGKEPGRARALSQEEIQQQMILRARQGALVVRLKGGDPFVFGRGGEEALACWEAGIPFEVVPGISSAIGVPAYAGIPVTHRGLASSFAVFTAHREALAALPDVAPKIDTLVFLMGMATLEELTQALLSSGRSPEEPCAVISQGTLPNQRSLYTTLQDLPQTARSASLPPPAVVVVGKVASLGRRLAWFSATPVPARPIGEEV